MPTPRDYSANYDLAAAIEKDTDDRAEAMAVQRATRDHPRAAADPVRKRMLELFAQHGELHGGRLAAKIAAEYKISIPEVYRHLRVLRETDWISRRYEGVAAFYRRTDDLNAWTPQEWAELNAMIRQAEKEILDALPTEGEKDAWRETIRRVGGVPPE